MKNTDAMWRVFEIITPLYGKSYVMSDREMTQAEVNEFMEMGSVCIHHKAVSDFSYFSNMIIACYSASKKECAKKMLADLVAGKDVFCKMFLEGEA